MNETAHAFFHLDPPSAHPSLSAGLLSLRGWAVGKEGLPLTDLRVRLADVIYPACFGFLRADLAEYFKYRDPHLPGGFEVQIAVPPGRHELVFEACDIAGIWQQVGTSSLDGEIAANARPQPAPRTIVQPHQFARALQLTLRRSAQQTPAKAAASVVAEMPRPQFTRFPHQPFHGHLEQPSLQEPAKFGQLEVEGWLFHETIKIRRVVATVDLQVWQTLKHGLELPYVAALFPQHANAHSCRIAGRIDVPAQLPSPLSVRVYAELVDGSWHLCQVQRTSVTDNEYEKTPFVRFSTLTFGQVCLELRRACQRAGLAVPVNRLLWRGIRGVYEEYRARAPRQDPASRRGIQPVGQVPVRHPGSIALFTHNLGYEGAPLFLLEYARELAAHGARLQLFSAAEGPLRGEYERLGAIVRILDTTALATSRTPRDLHSALAHLATQTDLRTVELVVANTLSAYWGIHLAHRAGQPSLFYIHESTTPTSFYLGQLASSLLPVIEETFSLATHVSFLTASTRHYYLPLLQRANHSINPGWISLDEIDRYFATNPRAALRHALGLAEDTRLVVNVGSVCNRKGQHIFARAVDLLWRQHPELADQALFLIVGGRATLFDQTMADLLSLLARPNLRIVPETDTPLAYYGAADLFVCSSYEESFPRVILEAMACHLPILSTRVHGIPEQIHSNREGLLVPAGDTNALRGGLARMLQQRDWAATLGAQARARVCADFDANKVLPRHLSLATTIAAQSQLR